MPRGICKLCLIEKDLRDSHYMPAAIFKQLRMPTFKNPNPVLITPDVTCTTSRQVKDYVLCSDCEQRFSKQGEAWVLANMARPGGFALQASLLAAGPLERNNDFAVFSGAAIPSINMDALAYFGMSIFWRAGAHRWPWEGEFVNLELGPYLEPIRLFLLDQGSFPDQMVLAARISGLKKVLELTQLPQARNRQGYHLHSFTIPGLAFSLGVGSRLPSNSLRISTAPSPEQFVGFCPSAELNEMMGLADVKLAMPFTLVALLVIAFAGVGVGSITLLPWTQSMIAHAGWRTDSATAAAVVLAASTAAARTAVPLGEARRVAREARAIAEGRAPRH